MIFLRTSIKLFGPAKEEEIYLFLLFLAKWAHEYDMDFPICFTAFEGIKKQIVLIKCLVLHDTPILNEI